MITLPGSIDEIETIDLLSKNQSHSSFFQINLISHSVHKNISKNCFHHQLFFDQRLLMAVTDQVVEHFRNEIFSIVD